MWSAVAIVSILGCVVAGPPVSEPRDSLEEFKAFLDRSRTDDGIRLEARMLENPKASAWENSGKYQGDILLDDEQEQAILQQYAQGRKAYIVPNTRWPGNTIVYEISNEFSFLQERAIRSAMREIESRTCLRFRARQWWENVFVRVTGRADGCYARVGYSAAAGAHTMNVARSTPGRGCLSHTIIIHEWLHIAGFFHMQSTYNRYNYVRILWENVRHGMAHNFDRFGTNIVSNLGLPYEYESNMHYGRYASSANGRATMLPLWNDHGLMGQQNFVTHRDWHRVNRHYNCPGAWNHVQTDSTDKDGLPVEEQNLQEPSQEEQNLLEPSQEEQNLQEPSQEEQYLLEPSQDEQNLEEPSQEEQYLLESSQEEQNLQEPSQEEQYLLEPSQDEQIGLESPQEETQPDLHIQE